MVTKNDRIMFYEVQRLRQQGRSINEVSKALDLNRRTVTKYEKMTEAEFSHLKTKMECKEKLLDSYEGYVRTRLIDAPAASTAQVHDWLKEKYPDFISVSPKTVYNFVMGVRNKYQIPVESAPREFFMVEVLPYGQQAQADFGQSTLLDTLQRRKKVYFFAMSLSRVRFKYVHYSNHPFTTSLAIIAHEAAFCFFEGVPKEVVYDQDRLFLVNENLGELLLTAEFSKYVAAQGFSVHFCRKSDPQSKGKVENFVKYIKQNFLYGRVYHDLQTLQAESMGWLQRTGNGILHSVTRKIPLMEWELEKPHLQQWIPLQMTARSEKYTVRKDHTISYKGNFYSVPQGTYKKGAMVGLSSEGQQLHIYDIEGTVLCTHQIPEGKGNSVLNTNHKRDRSLKIDQLIVQVSSRFQDSVLAKTFFERIRKDKGRYIRDHVQAIGEAIQHQDASLVSTVLCLCMKENYLSALLFKEQLLVHSRGVQQDVVEPSLAKIILLDPQSTRKAATQPAKSSLDTYEDIFKNQ